MCLRYYTLENLVWGSLEHAYIVYNLKKKTYYDKLCMMSLIYVILMYSFLAHDLVL